MNIENKKQLATILLAFGMGCVAVFLTSQYVQNKIQEQTKLLARDYQKKSSALVNELEMVKRELKRVASKQAALAKKQAQGGTAKAAGPEMAANVPQGAFSVKTPPGKRALTILIDPLSAVGGLINPGDFVDIIAKLKVPDLNDPKKKTREVTTVLFQSVQVLAIGTNFIAGGQALDYTTQQSSRTLFVTLALDPEESGLITFAQTNGKLQLALRSPTEQQTETLKVASWDSLSEYVSERQGTELIVPRKRASIQEVGDPARTDEVKPFIQIFKSGIESRL